MTVRQAIDLDQAMAQPPASAPSPIVEAANKVAADGGRALFDLLRRKWKEVPAGLFDRVDTVKVLNLSDWELRDYWEGVWHETSTGPGYATRGWYQEMYRDMFRGKRVLEIGSGCGIDGIEFIRQGAKWYFADIVPSNLKLIRRMLDAFGLDCEGMTYIEDFGSLEQIPDGFDFIYCNGSMIHVPFEFARRETLLLVSHLRPGGRWVELCYPQERWAREGRLPFAEWGRMTDGDATPWVEWYDLERLRDRFAPVMVKPLLAFNYYDDAFNWFDIRIDTVPDRRQIQCILATNGPKRLPIGLSPSAFKRHGASTIDVMNTPSGPALRVQTAPQIWSYAAQGTLSAATLRHALPDTPTENVVPAIEIAVSVQQGRVGIGLMRDDLTNYIDLERHLPRRDEPYVVRWSCPPGYDRYHLIMRNTQGGGQASIFVIHRMVLTSHRPGESAGAQGESGDPASVIALTGLVRRHLPTITDGKAGGTGTDGATEVPVFARAVAVDDLDRALGYAEASRGIEIDRRKSLRAWTMEADAPILAYLYRNHRPKRHLAIDASDGFGAALCATHSEAEIWAIDMPARERDAAGVRAAGTDRLAGPGHRIHQISADGRQWDASAFAPNFFDSALIAGGHDAGDVIHDTEKALPLLRPGGMMIWRDFCPVDGPMTDFPATRGTVYGVHQGWRRWAAQFTQIFWVRPSFILVGIKG